MANYITVINPVTVTPTMLTSNIPETDYPVWVSGTSYALQARVIYVHKIYERLIAGAGTIAPDIDTANWIEVSATNRYKMFDTVSSSKTTHATQIDVSVTPGTVVNGLALLDVSSNNIQVKMTDPVDGLVFDTTYPMQDTISESDYWVYCFEPIVQKTTLTVTNLPAYGTATLQVMINGSNVECGTCLIGVQQRVGETGPFYGAEIGITDYSRKERNQFGDLLLVERSWNKRTRFKIFIDNKKLDTTQQLFSKLRAVPTLWIASTDFESMIVYGYYKDFSAVIDYPGTSVCELEIEGLT